jgi:hypothetical protein
VEFTGFAEGLILDDIEPSLLTSKSTYPRATLNLKDFQNFGFKKVWNPLAATSWVS